MTRFRVSGKPPVKPQGEWLRVSHEMTWEVEEMADQETLVVKMSPDAGYDDSAFENGKLILWTEEKIAQARMMAIMQGGDPTQVSDDLLGTPMGEQHPGVTFPGLGIIEINPEYLPDGITPEDMSPLIRKDHQNYPVVWGLLSHEAAHAHFSKWMDAIDERASRGEIHEGGSKAPRCGDHPRGIAYRSTADGFPPARPGVATGIRYVSRFGGSFQADARGASRS